MPGTCPNGHRVDGADAFCRTCGTAVELHCPNGHPVDRGDAFCRSCGAAIAHSRPEPRPVTAGSGPLPEGRRKPARRPSALQLAALGPSRASLSDDTTDDDSAPENPRRRVIERLIGVLAVIAIAVFVIVNATQPQRDRAAAAEESRTISGYVILPEGAYGIREGTTDECGGVEAAWVWRPGLPIKIVDGYDWTQVIGTGYLQRGGIDLDDYECRMPFSVKVDDIGESWPYRIKFGDISPLPFTESAGEPVVFLWDTYEFEQVRESD